MGKLTLVLGGARSGKSTYAENLAHACSGRVAMIATAQALDDEMAARIAAHRQKRPADWITLEIPTGVGKSLLNNPLQADLIVLDCLTLLVSNLALFASPDVDNPDETAVASLIQAEVEQIQSAIRTSSADWIIVTNEVGLGLVPPYPLGRIYRDWLGWANQRLAAAADEVVFMLAGIPMKMQKPD